MSLPSWERGLKQRELESISNPATVAPLVGAWIETCCYCKMDPQGRLGRSPRGSVD